MNKVGRSSHRRRLRRRISNLSKSTIIESLEMRRLLTLMVTSPISDVTVSENSQATVIPLSSHFDNPDITGTVVQLNVSTVRGGPSGKINVELTDQATPSAVKNFLAYVNSGAYNNTFFHRVQTLSASFQGNSSTTLTFDANTNTITRSAGNFANEGFTPGAGVSISGTANNNFLAASVSAVSADGLTLTLSPQSATLTDETVSDSSNVVINAGIGIVQGGGYSVTTSSHIAILSFKGTSGDSLTFTPIDSTSGTITRSSGSFITDGLVIPGANQWIAISQTLGNNIHGFISSATDTTLTITQTSAPMSMETIANTAVVHLAIPAQGVTNTLTFADVDATTGTITRSSGSFLTEGFAVGELVTIQTSDQKNQVTGTVSAVTDTTLTLSNTTGTMVSDTLNNTSSNTNALIDAGISMTSSVQNEFDASRPNVAGTIAMAKTSDPNSATSEFFFNTATNHALDDPNNSGGFTEFGHILQGEAIADAIDSSPQVNLGGAFANLPVAPQTNSQDVLLADLVTLTSASVVNKIVTFGAQSSNTNLVTVAGNGTNLTLNFAPGATGTSLITITAIDATGAQIQTSFNVTVNGSHIVVKNGNTAVADNGTVNFGSAPLGGTLQQTLTISNTGNQTMNLGSASLPSGFSFVQAPPSTIAAGQSANIIIAADTSTPGLLSGTLTLPSDDPTTPIFHINLTAQVAQPDIVVSYSNAPVASGQTVDLGSLHVGDTANVTIHVSNDGLANLNLSAVTLPAGYTVVQALPALLVPNTSADLILAVDTSSPGTKAGTLTIPSNDPDTPNFSLSLTASVFFAVTLGTGGAKSVKFTDSDNTIAIMRLVGPGSATILFNGQDFSKTTTAAGVTVIGTSVSVNRITLAGTTRASQLLFSVSKGNGQVNVQTIDGTALGAINGRGVDVSDALTLPGLAMLNLATLDSAVVTLGSSMGALNFNVNNVIDSTITCAGAISQIHSNSWADTNSDNTLTASSVGVMNIAGSFASPVTLTGSGKTLTNAMIRGALSGGIWTSAGSAGNISAGSISSAWNASFGGNITTLSTKGNFSGSLVVAGLSNLSAGGSIASANLAASGFVNHVTAHSSITGSLLKAHGGFGSITAGGAMADSKIYAAVDPSSGLLPVTAAEFSANAKITSVKVKSFSDSAIAGGTLGNLILGRIATSNGGTPDGVAGYSLALLDGTTTAGKKVHLTKKQTTTQATTDNAKKDLALGDFEVKIIPIP